MGLLAALIGAAVSVVLDVVAETNDDDTYTFRVIQRIARRSGEQVRTDVPEIVFLEIDGRALPVPRGSPTGFEAASSGSGEGHWTAAKVRSRGT